jgi:hypothetical protein
MIDLTKELTRTCTEEMSAKENVMKLEATVKYLEEQDHKTMEGLVE